MPKRPPSVPKDDERGVSEVLGQVLVFSIVVASIGFIIATGFAGLEDTRDTEQFQNADRAFDVLADNMASVVERNNPSRATEIDVGDGRISYADPVVINITIEDVDGNEHTEEYELRPIELGFESDRSVVYEAGSVVRDQPRGGFVVREPPFLLSEDRVHIPIIQTLPQAERSLGGTTVLVRAVSRDRTVLIDPSDGDFVSMTINVTSDRAEQWAGTLEDRPNVQECPVTGNTASCELETVPDQTYVVLQRVGVSFDG